MNGITQTGAYGSQAFMPQGFFGTMFGAPVGGLIGRGIGSLFGQPGLGSQIGHLAGGIGGGLLPFAADPTQVYAQQLVQQQALQQQLQQLAQQQALQQQLQQIAQQQQLQQLAQQQQLAPQGWFGNLIGQIGQPVGTAIGGLYGQPALGGQIGSIAAQIGRLLPFQLDPMQQALAQQMAQQQWAQQCAQMQLAQQIAQQMAQQQPYGTAAQQAYATGQTLH